MVEAGDSGAPKALLDIVALSKSFPGTQALDQVSLRIRPGEIHALIGENGAGKSTLLKLLAGIHTKDSGTILLDGRPISPASPRDALALGLSAVHQEISLAPNLTVAENVFVGREPIRWDMIRWAELWRRTAELLRPFGVSLNPEARVASLNPGLRQIVEIARALSHRPKILMLDEPTSSLEVQEVERLLRLLRSLAAQGIGILYVTHKLREVFGVADTVTVLRDGKWVATMPAARTNVDELVRLMVGRELNQLYPAKSSGRGGELLRVDGLSLHGRFPRHLFCPGAGRNPRAGRAGGGWALRDCPDAFWLSDTRLGRGVAPGKARGVHIAQPSRGVRAGLSPRGSKELRCLPSDVTPEQPAGS